MRRKIAILLLTILILGHGTTGYSAGLPSVRKGFSDIHGHWAREEILEIAGLGYMEGSGDKFYPDRKLNYGEILTTIIRALGREGEAQLQEPKNHIRGIYQLAYDLALIEKPEDENILTPPPNARVSREEAINILTRALGITPPLGHEIREVKKFKDYKSIADHRLPYVELGLQRGYINGRADNTFAPKAHISRGEFAKLISNANEDLLGFRNVRKKTGEVTRIDLGQLTLYNTDATSHIVDYKNIQDGKKLEIGDFLTYYLDQDGDILYGRKEGGTRLALEGTIREIDLDKREIVIWDYNDKMHRVKLDPYIPIEDLYFEQEIELVSQGGQIVRMTTFNPIDPERDGYISPGSRFRVGTVLFVNNQEIEIMTEAGREKFQIDQTTSLYKKDQRVQLFQLKEGDRVVLSFYDIYSSQVSQIKIEDEEKHIGGLIKGRIELVDERNKEILINQAYELNQGQWQPLKSKERIRLGTGSIYEGGQEISLANLNRRKGEEGYIAYENSYGNKSIAKMLVKSGSAMEYQDKLDRVDHGTGNLVVDRTAFNFHEGTIVVKDNRLVDPLNLAKNQNVYLVADYNFGNRTASLVNIEDTGIIDDRIDGTRILVYKGKIEDISNYSLTLGRYNYRLDKEVLTDTGFKSSPGSEKLDLSLDTYIYDSELEKPIPSQAFLDSRFIDLIDIRDRELRDRIRKNHYKNKPAYLVARETPYGKEILSINLVPQALNSYNRVQLDSSSLAEIKAINIDENTMDIGRVKSHNNLTKRWEYSQDQTLDLDKAIILVNDQALGQDEIYKLRLGSSLYIIEHKDSSKNIPYILLVEY